MMQLHNLLTNKEKQPKREGTMSKSGSTGQANPRRLVKKGKSQPIGGGENLVKEIQAMIISQEMIRKNRDKMAKVGGHHAHLFLADPKLNEHKIIGEKFQKKPYTSLAVDLYKSKLQNNPMRYD